MLAVLLKKAEEQDKLNSSMTEKLETLTIESRTQNLRAGSLDSGKHPTRRTMRLLNLNPTALDFSTPRDAPRTIGGLPPLHRSDERSYAVVESNATDLTRQTQGERGANDEREQCTSDGSALIIILDEENRKERNGNVERHADGDISPTSMRV